MASFKQALEKGKVGEKVCRSYLEKRGWVVYQPMTQGAHAFDMLAIKDKQKAVALDVKAKARLNNWRATGIPQKAFEIYEAFSKTHLMPFWLFFVDECEKKVYGNCIEELEKFVMVDGNMYPRVMTFTGSLTRIWHLSQMIKIADLDDETVNQLSALSQRTYEFEPTDKV